MKESRVTSRLGKRKSTNQIWHRAYLTPISASYPPFSSLVPFDIHYQIPHLNESIHLVFTNGTAHTQQSCLFPLYFRVCHHGFCSSCIYRLFLHVQELDLGQLEFALALDGCTQALHGTHIVVSVLNPMTPTTISSCQHQLTSPSRRESACGLGTGS